MRSYAPYNSKLFRCESFVEAEAEIGELYSGQYTVFIRCQEKSDEGLCKKMKEPKKCKFGGKKVSELKEEFFPNENVFGLPPYGE
jgi:hypothetical protein